MTAILLDKMPILDVEVFIHQVQSHPILYDISRTDYKDTKKKDDIWANIAAYAGLENITEAKKKWKALRNCMSRYKKMMQNGRARKYMRPYKYAELLEFLVPHLIERDATSNNLDDADEITYVLKEEVPTPVSELYNDGDLQDVPDEADNDSSFSLSVNSESSTTMPAASEVVRSSPAVKTMRIPITAKRKHQSSESYLVNREHGIKRKSKFSTFEDTDDLSLFMKAMAGSIRRLPARVQSEVKFEIHRLIYEAEVNSLSRIDENIGNTDKQQGNTQNGRAGKTI